MPFPPQAFRIFLYSWCPKIHKYQSECISFLLIEMDTWRDFPICKVESHVLSSRELSFFSFFFFENSLSPICCKLKPLRLTLPNFLSCFLFSTSLLFYFPSNFLGSMYSLFSMLLFLFVWVFLTLETFLNCPVIFDYLFLFKGQQQIADLKLSVKEELVNYLWIEEQSKNPATLHGSFQSLSWWLCGSPLLLLYLLL